MAEQLVAPATTGSHTPSLLSLAILQAEALSSCAFLLPEDIARLLCSASWRTTSGDRRDLWHAYFVTRWGSDQGAGRNTEVRVMRSWASAAWPAPWPLAVGFCGALTAEDHLFWFLPFARCALRPDRPSRQAPTPPPSQGWQVACRVRARPRGAARLKYCAICDVLEVAPPGPAPQHFRQLWTRPCRCSQYIAHRACLERRLVDVSAQSVKSSSTGRRVAPRCNMCGREYATSRRFPETLAELLVATLLEWRWVLRRIFVMLVFFAWIYSLAVHYCGVETVSKELLTLLLLTACMMSISTTRRFHCSVQKIWNTPNRWRYFGLFGVFACQNYMVSLHAFQPDLWQALAEQQPWLAALHKAHAAFHGSLYGTLVLSIVTFLYVATASGVIFLFWKTSLRVPTVADAGAHSQEEVTRDAASDGDVTMGIMNCGLCQLGLCLDNTCM